MMEEAITLIAKGCQFAKSLETNLPIYLSNDHHPNVVLDRIEEIIGAFGGARDQILHLLLVREQQHDHELTSHHQHHRPALAIANSGLGISGTSSVPLTHGPQGVCLVTGGAGTKGWSGQEMMQHLCGTDREDSSGTMDSGSSGPSGNLNATRGSGTLASRQRTSRKRGDKHAVIMAAPLFGNTDVPPEDGFTWRKYGQKEILGARFPRSYYRCTHQKLYNCGAKKQVQRLDRDPQYYEVLYRGDHTCHMSSTAPSILPPHPQEAVAQAAGLIIDGGSSTQPSMTAPTTASTSWLCMDLVGQPNSSSSSCSSSSSASVGEIGTKRNLFDPHYLHMYRNQFNIIVSSGSNTRSTCSGGTGGAASSTVVVHERDQVQGDYQFVTDMADVMFNSGGDNNMELIFTPSSSQNHTHQTGEFRHNEKDT